MQGSAARWVARPRSRRRYRRAVRPSRRARRPSLTSSPPSVRAARVRGLPLFYPPVVIAPARSRIGGCAVTACRAVGLVSGLDGKRECTGEEVFEGPHSRREEVGLKAWHPVRHERKLREAQCEARLAPPSPSRDTPTLHAQLVYAGDPPLVI